MTWIHQSFLPLVVFIIGLCTYIRAKLCNSSLSNEYRAAALANFLDAYITTHTISFFKTSKKMPGEA
jgi:hypothetical protein